MSAPTDAPGHKGAQHWMNKRWLQLQQRRGETEGTRVGTDFAEEFKNMQKMTMAMEKSYKKIPDKLEMYLQPDPTKRLNARLFNKQSQVLTEEMISRETLSKLGEVMVETGQAFGEDTSLGQLYMVVGEAQREITKSWLTFQFETGKKYLKPLSLFCDDLKDVKKNLEKVEKDRLFLDATKARGQAARTNVRNFDPSVCKHLETKAQRLHASLEEKAGNVQEQMEQFFYELEDDQMFILQNFVSAEIEYHRSALEALADVGAFINALALEPTYSILKHARGDNQSDTRSQTARAVYDFEPTNADELGFVQGDVLNVVSMDVGQDGWWLGEVNGEQGLIPAAYVELIAEVAPPIDIPVLAPHADIMGTSLRRGSQTVAAPAAPVRDEAAIQERDQLAKELASLKQQREQLLVEQKQTVQAAAHATQDMQRQMFGTALDMAMRQVANTLKTLENDRKTCARPDFKASPAEFDGTFDVLMGKAQDIMNVVKGLLKDAQQGNWADMQVQITHAIEELQRLALDARQMSSALLRREDRDAILVATSGIVSSLETMLKTLKAVDGQPKETVKAKLSPLSKQAAGTISQLLDSMEAARSAQAKELSALEAKAKQAESVQEQELLEAARKIARVAEDLAAMQRAGAALGVHKSMVGSAQEVTGSVARLVKVATECQRAISKAQGTGGSGVQKSTAYFSDGTWSEGLVSAAKMVADSVQDMLTSANDIVSGGNKVDLAKVDRLRAVANSINALTVQVVMASSSRNPDRTLQRSLQEAASDVQRTSDLMVSDINGNKAYGGFADDGDLSKLTATQRRKAEIEAQTNILKAQRDLEMAQKALMALRKNRYVEASGSGGAPPAEETATQPPVEDDDDDIDSELLARLNRLKQG